MKRSRPVAGALVMCVALLAGAVPVSAAPNNNNSEKLRRAVTVEGILEHEQAFQDFSDAPRRPGTASRGHRATTAPPSTSRREQRPPDTT